MERKIKLFTMNIFVASLLLLGILNPLAKPSVVTESADKLTKAEGAVAGAAETTTGGSISGDEDGEFLVRIILGGDVVESKYYDYGEKLVLSNYTYNGRMIERWSCEFFYLNDWGVLDRTETVEVINRTLELTITHDINIKGYTYKEDPKSNNCMDMQLKYYVAGWEPDNYPYYVGGAYENNSKWIIYLKENTIENQDKIKSQIYDWEKPIFVSCNYSHKELEVARDEIKKNYPASASGIRSVSIECCQWQDGVTEPRVLVLMEGINNYDFLSAKFANKYGNKVMVAVYDETSGFTFPAHAPEKVTVKSAKIKKNKLSVKWKKAEGASKYQVQIFRRKKKIKTISTKKLTCKYSLKRKKAGKYYVKVRAYGKEAKRWGQWSKKVRVK